MTINEREMRRLYESTIPVLAFKFARCKPEEWAPPHRHDRGQLFAISQGLLIVETTRGRWLFPANTCAWIPPDCLHSGSSLGGTSGIMLFLSPAACKGLPRQPKTIGSSELLLTIVNRILGWSNKPLTNATQKRLLAVARDEIRSAPEEILQLPLPKQARLARVARMLMENVADPRTLDDWAAEAAMSRRTFMRAFSREMRMSFGRWRQQARLFAALTVLTEGASVTDAAMTVGYDSVSAFIEMFRQTLGVTPKAYAELHTKRAAPTPARSRDAKVSSPRRRS